MKRKLFSIITPTFNCGPKVENTIKSVFSQRRELFDYLIVDGGSTDDTLSVLRKYEGGLSIMSEKDRGIYDAFNKGIERTTGRYLYFLGAGDCLREGVLERIRDSIAGDEPDLIHGDAFLVNLDLHYTGNISRAEFRKKNICHQAVFYKRKLFEVMGKYDLKYKVYADWAFNLKCFGDRKIRRKYVNFLVADFEGGGLSDSQGDADFMRDYKQLIKPLGVDVYLLYKATVAQAYLKMYRGELPRLTHSVLRSLTSWRKRLYSPRTPENKTDMIG